MLAVLTMNVTVDDVVDVSVVWDRGVPATDPVNVIARMCSADVRRIARAEIGRREFVFVDVVAVRIVQVRVVDVIDVIVVADREVTAVHAVVVFVPIMNVRFHVVSSGTRRRSDSFDVRKAPRETSLPTSPACAD